MIGEHGPWVSWVGAVASFGVARFRKPLEVTERLEVPATATEHVLIGVARPLALAAKQPACVAQETRAAPLLTRHTNEQAYEDDDANKDGRGAKLSSRR
jgi:hypothetical protein